MGAVCSGILPGDRGLTTSTRGIVKETLCESRNVDL